LWALQKTRFEISTTEVCIADLAVTIMIMVKGFSSKDYANFVQSILCFENKFFLYESVNKKCEFL